MNSLHCGREIAINAAQEMFVPMWICARGLWAWTCTEGGLPAKVPPNAHNIVSANAGKTKPARLIAYITADDGIQPTVYDK